MREANDWKMVGRRIREARFLLGDLKQTDFGKFLGDFSAMQISNAERGKNPPTSELLAALVQKGINANYLLTGEGSVWIEEMMRRESPLTPEELKGVLEMLDRCRLALRGFAGEKLPGPPEMLEAVRRRMERAGVEKKG